MMRGVKVPLLLAGALLLPLAALSVSWIGADYALKQGTEWLIPVQGYDPRDLLRGHYVRYRYVWPLEAVDKERTVTTGPLCLIGKAPHISAVRLLRPDEAARDQPSECATVVRGAEGARQEVRGLESGILFTSQPRALALARQLADNRWQGMIRVRVGPNGVMRPVDLVFQPAAGRTR